MSRSHSVSVVEEAKLTISDKKMTSLEQSISEVKNESETQTSLENSTFRFLLENDL